MDRTFQWGDWSEAPRVHCFDPSCGSCGFAGPLQLRYGYQVQPGQRVRRLTQRSNLEVVEEGYRPPAPVATVTRLPVGNER